jgi:prepilin-type N-terminal cleavage/methylation domain-containing protein
MRQHGQPGAWRRRLAEVRSRRDQSDGGFTLVEVVITISLISLTILPILDATFTSVRASTTAREVAEVETVLQNAADRVNRAPTQCEYHIFIEAAAQAKGWDAAQATATYQYYVPGDTALASDPGTWSTPGNTVNEGCPGGARSPRLVQLVTITVSSDSGSINRTIQVVKSDV